MSQGSPLSSAPEKQTGRKQRLNQQSQIKNQKSQMRLSSSADHPIDRCLSTARDQQCQGDSEERHREFHPCRSKESGPKNAGDRDEHYTGNQECSDAGEQSQQ